MRVVSSMNMNRFLTMPPFSPFEFRYVYQLLDNLYLLLITNRASNIVEDLETLRLLSKGKPFKTLSTSVIPKYKPFILFISCSDP